MFTINKNHSDTIKQVCQSAASRSPIAAFQNVLITAIADSNTVMLRAGDSVTELTKGIEADVELDCAFQVDAAKFLRSFNACKKDVTITVKDLQIEIKSGRSKFKLAYHNADGYPSFPDMEDLEQVDITIDSLVNKMRSVSFAAPKDDVRFVLNGVHVGKHIVATNGHRMAWTDCGLDESFIVPKEAVDKAPVFHGGVYKNNNILAFIGDNEQFKTKLIDGQYVPYDRVIFESDQLVNVNKSDIIDAIKSVSITSNTETNSIVLHVGKESYVKSKAQNDESIIGFDTDDGFNHEIEKGFNWSYLIDALKSIESEQITIGFCEKGAVISDDNINNIVMGVKI